MNASSRRNHAMRLSASDPERALGLAEDIAEPWFAAQALAAVLRYCPAERTGVVMRRARARASRCGDAYGRGAVLAWVVRALAERDLHAEAAEVLRTAVQEALQATPAGSRGEALFLLYQAAHPLGPRVVEPVLRHLAAVQREHPHWRVTRALCRAGAMHSVMAPEFVESFFQLMGEPKLTERVRRYAGPGFTWPREFF